MQAKKKKLNLVNLFANQVSCWSSEKQLKGFCFALKRCSSDLLSFQIPIISLTRDIHKLLDELFEDFSATKSEQERTLRHQLSISLIFYF